MEALAATARAATRLPDGGPSPLEWFVPFVEQDNFAGDLEALPKEAGPVASQDDRGGVNVNEAAMDVLLRLPVEHFAAVVLTSDAWKLFLDTYLSTRCRDWDEAAQSRSEAQARLQDGLFACLHRLILDACDAPEVAEAVNASGMLRGPVVLDICALFMPRRPRETQRLVARMVELDGSDAILQELREAVRVTKDKVWRGIIEALNGAPEEFDDMVAYARDTACTLSCMCAALGMAESCALVGSVYATSADTFSLLETYEHLAAPLTQPSLLQDLHNKSVTIRQELLGLLHRVLFAQFWSPLNLVVGDEPGGSSKVPDQVDAVVSALIEVLEGVVSSSDLEGYCLRDYDKFYGLVSRLEDLVTQPFAEDFVDRAQYLATVVAAMPLSDWEPSGAGVPAFVGGGPRLSNPGENNHKKNSKGKRKHGDKRHHRKAESKKAMVKQVREVLPDLGTFFIEQLLLAVDNNVQQAVQSMLEGNLPAAVAELDPALEKAPLKPVNKGPQNAKDLFDQFAKAGRRDSADDDDGDDDDDEANEELKMLRERIKQVAAAYDEYEDEYDDAFDDAGFDVGDDGMNGDDKEDKDAPFDPAKWKPGMKDVDGVKRDADGKIVEEDEDDLLKPNPNHRPPKDSSSSSNNNNSRGGKRGGGRGGKRGGGGRGGGGTGGRDGAQKKDKSSSGNSASGGQAKEGTDKATRGRRKYKDVNKAKIANHSRKAGAAKKQSKGMF